MESASLKTTVADVTVVGAGVIGIVTALEVLRRGHTVTLVERDGPAGNCSRGNAGILAAYGVAPLSLPGILGKVPGMLLDPLGPLAIRRRHLFNVVPWLWRFWRSSEPAAVEAIAHALESLLGDTVAGYRNLVRGTGAEALVRTGLPVLCAYEGRKAYEKDAFLWGVRQRHGVRWRVLEGGALRELEPALAPRYRFGVALENCGYTLNPQRLATTLFDTYLSEGGRYLREEVLDISMEDGHPRGLETRGGRIPVRKLVVACGAWSGRLARRLGEPVPLQPERGYHVTLSGFDGDAPRHPVIEPARKVIATPMEMGLRVAGMVEFGGFQPPDYRRSAILRAHLSTLFPKIHAGTVSSWMGHRPSLPDSLPVIGPSVRHPSVYYAFGHQHVGLTGAPMTGRVIAELVSGLPPAIDVAPFRIDRF